MNAYPNGRVRVTDECLQIHHKPWDVFENSIDQEGIIGKGTEYAKYAKYATKAPTASMIHI